MLKSAGLALVLAAQCVAQAAMGTRAVQAEASVLVRPGGLSRGSGGTGSCAAEGGVNVTIQNLDAGTAATNWVNGNFTVESAPGKGTTICALIPLGNGGPLAASIERGS